MNLRDVIGRKIVAVDQQRITADAEYRVPACTSTNEILLDNGTRLRFVVHELVGDYAVEMFAIKAEKMKGQARSS